MAVVSPNLLTNSNILKLKRNLYITCYLPFSSIIFYFYNQYYLMHCIIIQCQVLLIFYTSLWKTSLLYYFFLSFDTLVWQPFIFVCRHLMKLNLSGTLVPEIGRLSYLEILYGCSCIDISNANLLQINTFQFCNC